MSRFNFRYQNLLEVKEKHEELIKGELSKIKKLLEDEKEKLINFQSNKEIYQEYLFTKIKKGTNAAYLQACNSYINHLDQKINEQFRAVEQCNQEVKKTRKKLVLVSQEKKVFEKLKEKEKKLFSLAEKKLENLLVDQLVTYKNFKRN